MYQGAMSKGDQLYNVRSRQRCKASRLVRMHANKLEVGFCEKLVCTCMQGFNSFARQVFTEGGLFYRVTKR